MRKLLTARTLAGEEAPLSRRVFRATLAEDYDGIGQYVLTALAGSSVSSAYKTRISCGDFASGQAIPRGTPVTVSSIRGGLVILSMGAK